MLLGPEIRTKGSYHIVTGLLRDRHACDTSPWAETISCLCLTISRFTSRAFPRTPGYFLDKEIGAHSSESRFDQERCHGKSRGSLCGGRLAVTTPAPAP